MAENTANPVIEKPAPKPDEIKTIGVLFPGQGNQYKGMGRQLCMENPAAKRVYDIVHYTLGIPYGDLFMEGEWTSTNILMATVTYSIAILRAREELEEKENLKPRISDATFYAGMSAGEIPALLAGGAFSKLEDSFELVYERALKLAKRSFNGSCMMRLSNVEDKQELDDICLKIGAEIGLWNAPDTLVVSGEPDEIQKTNKTIVDMGKNKIWRPLELKVNAPYHTRKFRVIAKSVWRKVLRTFHLRRKLMNPHRPVVANATGELYGEKDDAPELLEKQFYNTVLWYQTMMKWVFGKDVKGGSLAGPGNYAVDAVVEIGPKSKPQRPGGGSLSGLLKRFPDAVPILHLTNERQLRNTELVYSKPVYAGGTT
ncbi:ACP S-malonyltransferase [Candidatus Woesearchaeota archaeon]|nr:ACP S-malonyltransferase [Candidatus Woesearchaeota archaeon]